MRAWLRVKILAQTGMYVLLPKDRKKMNFKKGSNSGYWMLGIGMLDDEQK